MSELKDHELLAEFVRGGSETAFAILVARHINLVYSTALRFTANPHHAEEVTQVVFIILARKAGRLRRGTVLSGWLYQAARFTAANFVKVENRRRHYEQEACMQSTLNEPDAAAWARIAPLLDEAMGRLGETDRNAIVLRYFENKSAREVGALLNMNEMTVHKRTARALEKLRKLFGKRGVTLTAAVIAGTVAANSLQAAPAGLAASISVSVVKGTAVTVSTATLVKGTIKIMMHTKLKFALGVAAAILLAGGAVTMVVFQDNEAGRLQARAIARKTLAAYAALSSYSDDGVILNQAGSTTLKTLFSIRMQRPDFYRIEWAQPTAYFTNGGSVWSDGTGNYLVTESGANRSEPAKNADRQTLLNGLAGNSGQATTSIPGPFFRQNLRNALNPDDRTLQKQADDPIDGVDCYVISRVIAPTNLVSRATGGEVRLGKRTLSYWIGKQDYLIHQIQTLVEQAQTSLPLSDSAIADMLAAQHQSATPEAITALRATLDRADKQAQKLAAGALVFTQTHRHISINQTFAPADFSVRSSVNPRD